MMTCGDHMGERGVIYVFKKKHEREGEKKKKKKKKKKLMRADVILQILANEWFP
jgi:hypothetical protein